MIEVFVTEFPQHSRIPEFTYERASFPVQPQHHVWVPWIVAGGGKNFNLSRMRKISRFDVIEPVLVAVRNPAKYHRSMNLISPFFGTVGVVANEEIVNRKIHIGPSENGQYFIHLDRKSTRLNSSHVKISYAVFCLKKKNKNLIIKHASSTK